MVPSEQNLLKASRRRSRLRRLPLSVLFVALAAAVFVSCREEVKRYVPNAGPGDVTPTMSTSDVNTLISDSGYTRYHMQAPVWLMFEDAEDPFWRFPEGLELEQYDLEMNPKANVRCDSAIYFSRRRLWRLDGNVVMVNTQADSFLTHQLFWDQNSRKIYTDSFIHIVRTDRIIEGYGMESDQSMLYYTVHRPTAILPANSLPGGRRDSSETAEPETDNAEQTPASGQKSSPTRKPGAEAFKAVDMNAASTGSGSQQPKTIGTVKKQTK